MEALLVVLDLLERHGMAPAVNAAPADVPQGALQLIQADLQRLFVGQPRCGLAVLGPGLPKLPPALLLRLRPRTVRRATGVALAFFSHGPGTSVIG